MQTESDNISAVSVLWGLIIGFVIFYTIPDKNTSGIVAIFGGWLTASHIDLRERSKKLKQKVKDLEWTVGTHLSRKE